MANPWITDLNHLLEAENEAAPPKAMRLRGHLTSIVKAATAMAARRETETALRCQAKSQPSPCRGYLRVRLQDIPSEIHWHCGECQAKGVILNWPYSPWDLSPNGEARSNGSAPQCTVLIDPAHYQELCSIDFMDPLSERSVFSARPKKGKIALSGSVYVFEDILGELAAEANYESRKARQRKLDRLLQNLNADPDLNSAFAVSLSAPHPVANGAASSPDLLADDFLTLLEAALHSEGASAEQLNWRLAELAQFLEAEPWPESGEMSSRQLQALLRANWESHRGAIRFCETLPGQEVERCWILQNVRPFLFACQVEGGVPATAAGNLNRQFVEQMIQTLPASEQWRHQHRRYRKVWNEADFPYLHMLRLLSVSAGLLKLVKRSFCVTAKGRRLLAPERGSQLYGCLFLAHFQKLDWASLDRFPENDALKATIAYSLYTLSRQGCGWQPSQQLASQVLLPAARRGSSVREVESRLLEPLVQFGLLDKRPIDYSRSPCSSYEVRKTPLFDRFIRFHLHSA